MNRTTSFILYLLFVSLLTRALTDLGYFGEYSNLMSALIVFMVIWMFELCLKGFDMAVGKIKGFISPRTSKSYWYVNYVYGTEHITEDGKMFQLEGEEFDFMQAKRILSQHCGCNVVVIRSYSEVSEQMFNDAK